LSDQEGNIRWRASYKTWGATVQETWEVTALNGESLNGLAPAYAPSASAETSAHTRADAQGNELEQNLRFQGQYLDRDTGLHYNTFRFYDPDIGRFISPDLIGLNGGPHLQQYSPNPISWIDPLGLTTCKMSAADKRAMGKPPPGMINPHRHHVMREMAPKGWSKADRGAIHHVQNLAKKFGIDINRDPRNFTWAQNGGGAHTTRAAAAVRDRLVPAARQGLAAFEAELAKLRIEMSQGKFW
jgi:RHS repeat-associated protein